MTPLLSYTWQAKKLTGSCKKIPHIYKLMVGVQKFGSRWTNCLLYNAMKCNFQNLHEREIIKRRIKGVVRQHF